MIEHPTDSRLTHERLRSLLDYDQPSGWFTNRFTRNSRAPAGQRAGCIKPDGYRSISIDNRLYQASRLAYFWMTGKWPDAEIDHRDRDRANDSWDNLRPATRSQNMANHRMPKPSGLPRGVYPRSGGKRFQALIRYGGKSIHLGSFPTPALASAAYQEAATRFHGDFAFPAAGGGAR
jgi:hypothetical protein